MSDTQEGFMGFRYRKSVRVGRSARVNLGSRGASLSLGRPGATVNVSSRGTRATFGLPGTGISYSTRSVDNGDALGIAVVFVLVFAVVGFVFHLLAAVLGAADND